MQQSVERLVRSLRVDNQMRDEIVKAVEALDTEALRRIENNLMREISSLRSKQNTSRNEMFGMKGPAYQMRGYTSYRQGKSSLIDAEYNKNIIAQISRCVISQKHSLGK